MREQGRTGPAHSARQLVTSAKYRVGEKFGLPVSTLDILLFPTRGRAERQLAGTAPACRFFRGSQALDREPPDAGT